MSEAGTQVLERLPAAVVPSGSAQRPDQTLPPAVALVHAAKAAIQTGVQSAPAEPSSETKDPDAAAIWKQVTDRSSGRAQRILLGRVQLESLKDGIAMLAVPASAAEMLAASLEDIGNALGSVTGKRWTVEVREVAEKATEAVRQPQAEMMTNADDNPLVKRAAELFGARVVSVQPRRAPGVTAAIPLKAEPERSDVPTMDHTGDE